PTCCSTLSLHDALPIFRRLAAGSLDNLRRCGDFLPKGSRQHQPIASMTVVMDTDRMSFFLHALDEVGMLLCMFSDQEECRLHPRSEEHTSELQSRENLV